MKGGTYTKTLAKIQVRGIFRIRWRRHAGAHLDELQHGGRNPTETSAIFHPFLLQKSEFILPETHKHYGNSWF